MDEKKLWDAIQDSAKDLEIPESLTPKAIEKKLSEQKNSRKREAKRKKKFLRLGRSLGMAAAAVLVFAVGLKAWELNGSLSSGEEKKPTAADAGTEAEEKAGMTALAAKEEMAGILEQDNPEEATAAKQEDDRPMEENTTGGTAKGDGAETDENVGALSTASEGDSLEVASPELAGFSAAESYEEVFEVIQEYRGEFMVDAGRGMTGMIVSDTGSAMADGTMAVAEDAAYQAEAAKAPWETGDYSQTNLQELGVDEGDIVKTDGKYLYILSDSLLKILKVSGTELEEMSTIFLKDVGSGSYFQEIYVEGSRLVLVSSGNDTEMRQSSEEAYRMVSRNYTTVSTYDLADPENPVLSGSVEVDGCYRTSRRNGDYLYLLTDYTPPVIEDSASDSVFIPLAGGAQLRAEEILLPDQAESANSLVAVSVDLNRPGEILDKKALVGVSHLIYVSTESIYLTRNEWNSSESTTSIMKFSYRDGILNGAAVGSVPGILNDSFSMNEYEGKLRVVTTRWLEETENGLYVLDENLDIIGRLDNLAPGEQIYSARFLGENGYFVTYRNIDPLFSVDLSNPEEPVILGELKITGFSSYLHFYGENRLLGIGKETDPETGEILGLKLSMFDISDPSNVTEEHKYIIEGNQYCPGLDNYKAILADPGKNIIGFAAGEQYLVFSYKEDSGFANHLIQDVEGNLYEARGVYIANLFYLVDSGKISIFDMERNGYQKLAEASY